MKRRFLSFFPALFLIFARIVSTGAVESGGFSGVEDSGGYEEAIQWAAERRYINGYSDGRFVPRITPRAEVAYALYQYQNLSASGSSQSSRILRQI